jgi:hypothetical protein
MSAGIAIPTGAGITTASARSSCNGFSLTVGIKNSQFPFYLFTSALFTFKRSILLAHGTDGFKFLLAGLANIFINGHKTHLVQ